MKTDAADADRGLVGVPVCDSTRAVGPFELQAVVIASRRHATVAQGNDGRMADGRERGGSLFKGLLPLRELREPPPSASLIVRVLRGGT
jgi:hypothetical protein